MKVFRSERMQKTIAKLSGKSFLSNILALVSGSVVAQAITVLASPVLTRLYTPTEMGIYTNYVSILTVLSAIVCLRYDQAIVLPKSDEEAANVFAVCVTITLEMSVITAAIIIPLHTRIASLLRADELSPWLCLIPLSLLTTGVTTTLQFWNSRKRNFKRVALVDAITAGAASGSQILMGGRSLALRSGMILGHVAGHGIGMITLLWETLKNDSQMLRDSIRRQGMKEVMVRYQKFPMYVVPGSLCYTLSSALPSLLLSSFFGPTTAAYYSLSYRLLALPLSLVGASISKAFYPEAQSAHMNGKLPAVAVRMFSALMRTGGVPLMLLALIAPNLVVIVLGSNWYTAGRYTQWLALWLLMGFLYSPLSCIFLILEKQNKSLLRNAGQLLVCIIALIVPGIIGNSTITIATCGITGALVAFASCLYVLWLAGARIRQILVCFIKEIIHSLPYVIPTVIVLLIVGQSLWSTCVAIMSGCVFLLMEGKNIFRMFE